MIIVFIILIIALIIGCSIGYNNTDYNEESWILGIIVSIILFIVTIIVSLVLIDNVKQLDITDKKIQMYQEENNKIESDIDILVKQYIEYEQNTFKNAKQESSMVLVNLYPELKSNELVQEQIKVYTDNNYQIKKLKEKKLDYQVSKWWLYFGKVE